MKKALVYILATMMLTACLGGCANQPGKTSPDVSPISTPNVSPVATPGASPAASPATTPNVSSTVSPKTS